MSFEDFDRGRLASTVLAKQGIDLALVDVERHPVDGMIRAVVLVEIGDVDGSHVAVECTTRWRLIKFADSSPR